MSASTNTSRIDANHPWPGLLPFTEDATAFFHGRETESAELTRLIEREPLTVLFGQSGLGKSSLLNAGVFPRLRRAGHLPIYLRMNLDADAPRLMEQVWQTLKDECARHEVTATEPKPGDSFWKYLHRPETELLNPHGRPVTPVFAFDQFEEIFTLGRQTPQQITRCQIFLRELGELIENRLPPSLEDELTEHPEALDDFDLLRQNLKIVFTFREDYLAEFEGLKTLIRPIMQNRMRLTPMTGNRAAQAVKLSGQEKVSDAVAVRIVRFVGGAGRDETIGLDQIQVEPALLSLVCRELNEQRLKRGDVEISADLIQGENTQQIIEQFYRQGFVGIDIQVKHFVEDQLLTTAGYRDSYALENALAQPGVTAVAIQTLVDRRILRREERGGLVRLELIHDVLAEVAKTSRDQRRAEAALAEAQRQIAKQKQRQRLFAAAAAVLLAVFVGISWLAIEASRARDVAEEQRQAAINATKIAEAARETAEAQRLVAEAAEKRAEQGKAEADQQRQATEVQRVVAETARADGETTLGFALAEKADRSFTEGRANDGQIFAAHALVRLSRTGGERAETVVARLRAARIALPGVQTFALQATTALSERVVFSNDGRLVAELSVGTAVRVWNTQSRKLVATFNDGEEGAQNMVFSPDGRILATASRDRAVRLFDVVERKLLHELTGHEQLVSNVVFSADGSKIVSWSSDKSVRIWDVGSGKPLHVLKGHQLDPFGAAFSSDGRRLISWSGLVPTANDPGPRLWDVASGKLIAILPGHQSSATIARFSPDSRTIVSSASGDAELKLWSSEDGRRIGEFTAPNFRQPSSPVFSPDGRLLAAVGIFDGGIRLWNVESRAVVTHLYGARYTFNILRFSDDGRALNAFSPQDSVIRRWDVASGRPLSAINALGTPAIVNYGSTPDLRLMGIAPRDVGGIRVAQQASGPSIVSRGNALSSWWPANGRPLVLLRSSDFASAVIRDAEGGPNLITIPENTRRLPVAAFSPDGQSVALSAADNAVRLWDTKTAKLVGTLKGHTDEVHAIRYSADGRMIVTTGADKTLRLWETVSGAPITTIEGIVGQAYGVAISPDGRTIATGSNDKTIRLWDVPSKTQVGTLLGHTGAVIDVIFSPDGRMLASGGGDRTVRVWNLSDRSLRISLPGHSSTIFTIAFSPDSQLLVSGGEASESILWDIGSAKATKIFNVGFVRHLAFSPDGTALMVSTDRSNLISLWRDFKREDGITDWRAQAAKDEARYGMKLEGISLVPK